MDIYGKIAETYRVHRGTVIKVKRIKKIDGKELDNYFKDYADKRDNSDTRYRVKNVEINSIVKRYEPLGISRDTIIRYRYDNPDADFADIVKHYDFLVKQRLLKKRCKEENLDERKAMAYLRKHQDMEVEDIIKFYKTDSLKDIAKRNGIKYSNFTQLLRNHPEMSIEDAINYYRDDKPLNNKELCNKYGINYLSFCTTKGKYNLSAEETIKRLLKYKDNFKEMCRKYELDYEKTRNYKKNHKLSEIEAILHFRKDLYLNALGELVSKEEVNH